MRSASDVAIFIFLCTTVTIATATTYIYGRGNQYNSQSINEDILRKMMNFHRFPVVMNNVRILPLMRMPLGLGGMGGKGLNGISQGATIGGGNGLGLGINQMQNGHGIRMGLVGGGNGHLGMNRVQNGFGIGMGSVYGRMNKMTGGMLGGPQGTPFRTSFLPDGYGNIIPKVNGLGSGINRFQNGLGNGMGSGYGRMTKMTGGMLGGPQGAPFGTSFLPGGYGNMIPKVNGLGSGINRFQNGLGNGMGSEYGRMNKIAGGMPGGAQLPSYGMSLSSDSDMSGFGGEIGSAGLETTYRASVGNLGADTAMKQGTGIGHLSSGNQGIGGMVSYGYSSTGKGGFWGINDDALDNFDHFDDSDDLGVDFASDFDDIFDH